MKHYFIFLILIALILFPSRLKGNKAEAATSNYEGYILLDVQRHGEAYYIYHGEKYYLGRPSDAFRIMTKLSLGISEDNFKNGFRQVNDIYQIYRIINPKLYPYIAGRIVLRAQVHGEAYYIYHGEKYYLGRPTDAFRIMTKYGMGAPSRIIDSIPTGTLL